MAHGEVYSREYGWDATFETLVARIVADYAAGHDPARENAWVAEMDGRRVGDVFCIAADEKTAQLRLLLVDPAARGHRIGGRLVDECIAFAKSAGYVRMTLWTNHPLTVAQRIYLSRGFSLVAEQPHRSWGACLTGQVYERDLTSTR